MPHTYIVASIQTKADGITYVGGTVDGVGVNIAFQNQAFVNATAFETFISGLMLSAAFPVAPTAVTTIVVGNTNTSSINSTNSTQTVTFVISFTS
jgi:hypothetical protein